MFFRFRCLRSQDCTSAKASGSNPVQPQGCGWPTPRADLLDATCHQPAASTSGGCKSERHPLHRVRRSGSAPDLVGLSLGSSGSAALSVLHLPTYLLPPPRPSKPHSRNLVWRYVQPLWAGGFPVSGSWRDWRILPEKDFLPAPRDPVGPPLYPPSAGDG